MESLLYIQVIPRENDRLERSRPRYLCNCKIYNLANSRGSRLNKSQGIVAESTQQPDKKLNNARLIQDDSEIPP